MEQEHLAINAKTPQFSPQVLHLMTISNRNQIMKEFKEAALEPLVNIEADEPLSEHFLRLYSAISTYVKNDKLNKEEKDWVLSQFALILMQKDSTVDPWILACISLLCGSIVEFGGNADAGQCSLANLNLFARIVDKAMQFISIKKEEKNNAKKIRIDDQRTSSEKQSQKHQDYILERSWTPLLRLLLPSITLFNASHLEGFADFLNEHQELMEQLRDLEEFISRTKEGDPVQLQIADILKLLTSVGTHIYLVVHVPSLQAFYIEVTGVCDLIQLHVLLAAKVLQQKSESAIDYNTLIPVSRASWNPPSNYLECFKGEGPSSIPDTSGKKGILGVWTFCSYEGLRRVESPDKTTPHQYTVQITSETGLWTDSWTPEEIPCWRDIPVLLLSNPYLPKYTNVVRYFHGMKATLEIKEVISSSEVDKMLSEMYSDLKSELKL